MNDIDPPSTSEPLSASQTRWRPLRSGLINFYRYDNQEFHFHHGRLLLRGNNGTGKSRVLALQLPFLLDGEISPERVEPDCDKAKRFEWNLLMGRHDDRLGYTWIEFVRTPAEGPEEYLTLGCGVRAAAGRGVVGKWFFTTTRRIGSDLSLCSSQNSPLPKDALSEALGDQGRVFLTASAYREAVNHHLFGLTPERYEALIKLLIELRQPKLSRHLDEKTLSAAMSDALTPVRPEIIQQIGDAMRAMEQDRQALADLQSARQSTESFLTEYRRYAQMIACRRSEEVRKSHSAYENRHRKLRDVEAVYASAVDEARQLKTAEEQLALEMAAAEGKKATLESSPEMRSARNLESARIQAEERRADADRSNAEHLQSVALGERLTLEHAGETKAFSDVADRLTASTDQAGRCAGICELDRRHLAAAERARLPQPNDPALIETSEKQLAKACGDVQANARLLRQLNGVIETARQAWRQSLDLRDAQAGRVAEIDAAAQAGAEAVVEAVRGLSVNYRQWHQSRVHLNPAPPQEVLPAVAEWSQAPIVSASPLRQAVDRARNLFREQAAADRAAKSAERTEHQLGMETLMQERDRLLHGQHQPPPVPYTRDPQARVDRPGAPLWRLCEFADGLTEAQRAGLEAALESAGILDAWVSPDGAIADAQVLDTFLHADGAACSGATLLDCVHPTSDWPDADSPPVPAAIVEGILRRIGMGEGAGPVWVDVNGRWRVGVLSGQWSKPAAEHIGQAAHDAARLRRIDDLNAGIEQTRHSISMIARAIDQIDDRCRAADAEADAAPSDEAIRTAIADRDARRRQLLLEQLRLDEAETVLNRRQDELRRSVEQRDTAASDLGLLNWVDRLQALDDALGEYRQALSVLWPAAREYIRSAQLVEAARARLDDERRRSEHLAQANLDAAQKAIAAESHHQTLQQTIGAAVQEVQRQLRDALGRINQLAANQNTNARAIGMIHERIRQTAVAVEELKNQIEEDAARRDAAIKRLLRFTQSALVDITDESLVGVGRGEMAVTAAVELARRIDAALSNVDSSETAWANLQKSIHNHIQNLTSALQSHDYRPEIVTEDDILLVTAPLHGVKRPMRDFASMLTVEIDNRRSLLSAQELELLENYLIHDVAVELGKLIRDAEELVKRMNQQLARRPNSTGMLLRFNWQPDAEGPPAFIDARKKLMGEYATWSPDDRTALGRFLQEQIARVREADATGTWQEQLSAALDYRQWHTFHVERRQENKWMRLTRKTHGTGSGGEKALALTIPQFAAAAAYYDTAAAHAPRLILLDEAFVGIDRDMRGKCMALLHEFDLDFAMTSEVEWGCYPTMPGLAIYQLSAREGIDAIWASRWVWNGRERVQLNPAPLLNGAVHSANDNGLFSPTTTDEAG